MAHQRNRHSINIIAKRMKLWPVLGLLGARQVGKSTLLRNQISQLIGSDYITFDHSDMVERALKQPQRFVESFGTKSVIIDEVQKVPKMFDAIKAEVDIRRRPGRFLLSGSSQFSAKLGIRESLTGRIGILRLYPLTLAEAEEMAFSDGWVTGKIRKDIINQKTLLKRIEFGGMPGICFLRSTDERDASFDSWLDTTCHRDLQNIHGVKLSGNLARDILQTLAVLDEPSIAEVAAALKLDARRIRSHVEALECLFAVQPITAHRNGVGKTYYEIFDSGLAHLLKAPFLKKLKIWLINECLAQYEYSGQKCQILHYRSSKRSKMDFVIVDKKNTRAVLLTDEEAPSTYTLRTAEAFVKRIPDAEVLVLAPTQSAFKVSSQIKIVPWFGFV